ncbi:MAG: radical SAM protein [Bdellovibrionales bacterium]|nr:radical SAM protein [Bdellovibrionales bacterium]
MTDPFNTIDLLDNESLRITWDLGRRCNFDCTYCPDHRHDNFSPHSSFDKLRDSAQFVYDYLDLVMPHRNFKAVTMTFTGGEPTINPAFTEFGEWLRQTYERDHKDKYHLSLALTSNGATSSKICKNIKKHYDYITISYHTEGPAALKEKVKANILDFHRSEFPMKINVMFHAETEKFNECLALCEWLESYGIDYVPRLIGEYEDNNRYHHEYTKQQLDWIDAFWKTDHPRTFTLSKETNAKVSALTESKPKKEDCASSCSVTEEQKKSARSLGRPCCGKRLMNVKDSETDKWEETRFLKFAKFKDWYCSVNWFFFHIEQQTDQVFFHQTCQADFGKRRGAIGSLSQSDEILDKLRLNIAQNTMPLIQCPNKMCGCGLCTPKAKNLDDLKAILPNHLNIGLFENTDFQT